MYLETDRLIIRDFLQEDWVAVHRYAIKPEVVRFMIWGPNTEEETKNHVEASRRAQAEENRRDFEFAIVLKDKNILIGGCGIHKTSSNCEIGYCLDSDYWGRGYASEAAKALVEFGFNQLKAHRIFAFCRPENKGSEGVMKKIGMKKEGLLRENIFVKGKYCDSLLYSILSCEFTKQP